MTFDEFTQSYKARKVFNATVSEWKIFTILVFREQANYDTLINALWPDPDGEPNDVMRVIQVFVRRLRAKVTKLGMSINLIWGQGYFMSKEDRAKALKLAEEAMNR